MIKKYIVVYWIPEFELRAWWPENEGNRGQ